MPDSSSPRKSDSVDPRGYLAFAHPCPIHRCPKMVPEHQLMCGRHWRLVSPNLQRRLYEAWDRGRGAGSDLHQEVMRLCIEEVAFKLRPDDAQQVLG